MLYFANLPFPYPINPILYILLLIPFINTFLCKIPLAVFIIYLFKLASHVFDYFVEKKEEANVKEGLSQSTVKAYQEVKTTCIDLKERVCEYGKELVRSLEGKQHATEVRESPKEFTVLMDAPGMKKEDFKVEVDGTTLLISGNRIASENAKEKTIYSERVYGDFSKRVPLDQVADMTSAVAKYDNGILTMIIPKRTEVVSEKKDIKIDWSVC